MGDSDIRRSIITTATTIGDTVRTTLGPHGMNKMMVDPDGYVVITNDGSQILNEMDLDMDIAPPAAKLLIEAGNEQAEAVGDGTTTTVILASELLARAGDLLEDGVHPTTIAEGYLRSADRARGILEEQAVDRESGSAGLERIAGATLNAKGIEHADVLAALVVRAVRTVEDDGQIDLDDVTIDRRPGGSGADSELVEGVVVTQDRAHPAMPERVEDARVGFIDDDIEVSGLVPDDVEINVNEAAQIQTLLEYEEEMRHRVVSDFVDLDLDALICLQSVDDSIRELLAREGIYTVWRPNRDEFEKGARATGATPVSELSKFQESDIGHAGVIREDTVGDEQVTLIEECTDAKSLTLVLRGGTEHSLEEVERVVNDALWAVESAVGDDRILPGGGATELALARELETYATSIEGREQLAVDAFAEAMLVIPRTLALNAGEDPIQVVSDLRSSHDGGTETAGIDGETGATVDMFDRGIVDPLPVKVRAIDGAASVVARMVRIDDVVSAEAGDPQEELDDEGLPEDIGDEPMAPGM